MEIVIRRDPHEWCGSETAWEVWVWDTPSGQTGREPWKEHFGFIIGVGATRDAAVVSAVEELEEACEMLQDPPPTQADRSHGISGPSLEDRFLKPRIES